MKIKSVKIFDKHRGELIELERKDILKYFDEDIMNGDEIEIVRVEY